jgi:colanic acid biosynthesis protein WcaH
MWLTDETFRTVVASTPLVSIDLVVQNAEGEILLGQRLNRPAQGFWFVPGGRIQKNESLDDAFRRLTLGELGQAFERRQARLLDVYEHFYADSVFGAGDANPDTHYVVLGYQLVLPADVTLSPPANQHDRYRWWSMAEMQACAEVHDNTRAYLRALR